MPRSPDPKSKTNRLVIQATNDLDKECFRKLKEICAEKKVTLAAILRPFIGEYVQENWPPNPQLQMGQFTGKLPLSPSSQKTLGLRNPIGTEKCQVCGGYGWIQSE